MNWKSVIAEIAAGSQSQKGMTQKEIAEAVGCGQATISELATEKQKTTSFEVGKRLLDLHKKVSGAKAA